MTWEVRQADCIEAMRQMDEASVDAIVTDPPYGLEFMGKEWDRLQIVPTHTGPQWGGYGWHGSGIDRSRNRAMQEWHQAWATEALRLLKPGGHLLAFGGTRTYHRLVCAVEDAGFEIRDSVIWLYGSGFPKSLDVSKAIDKRPGVSRHAEFAVHLRERMAVKGYTNTFDVAERVIGRRTGAVANWQKYQWPEAKWWPKLRDLLDLDVKWGPIIAEAEREKVGEKDASLLAVAPGQPNDRSATTLDVTEAQTPEAQKWNGYGTALKPAHEPIVVARKPLSGTVAQTVLGHGTGALNIAATRIRTGDDLNGGVYSEGREPRAMAPGGAERAAQPNGPFEQPAGRWPANVALSHIPPDENGEGGCEAVGTRKVKGSRIDKPYEGDARLGYQGGAPGRPSRGVGDSDGTETVTAWRCAEGCPVRELDRQSGERPASFRNARTTDPEGATWRLGREDQRPFGHHDVGGASRFFYVAKASRAERNAGLEGFGERESTERHHFDGLPDQRMAQEQARNAAKNNHPTVKPIDLMRWLVRLVTPPEGTVLDPFAGSGTTGCAAVLEGFDFLGIEREAEYAALARARIEWWVQHKGRDAEEVLAISRRSDSERQRLDDMGQLGLDVGTG